VPDLPFSVPAPLQAAALDALDREGKLDRALEALGPLAGRSVVTVAAGERQVARWSATGATIVGVEAIRGGASSGLGDGSADVIVSPWAAFRGVDEAELAEADRILRPAGRLLVLHDYGRDDLATLRGDQTEFGTWTRRDGPFLTNGFRVRVIHCFWTFDDLDAARQVVGEAFGASGQAFAAALKRPRLSWNVAIYHRTRGGVPSSHGD
jgi:hypothetical protein